MEPGPVVFDISSDEEESGVTEPKGDEYDWLAEYLDSDDKKSDDDSDEVVVLGEVKPKSRSKSSKPTVVDGDDDCVVLDGDPDKPVVDDAVNDSDELLIVGEKGQFSLMANVAGFELAEVSGEGYGLWVRNSSCRIACRDFPHSRHLCASFPFNTTPHEKHCDQCHCYVCDLPAPCVHWATCTSSIDHCHATDKEETWRIQRRSFKLGKIPPLPPSKFSDGPPQLNQVSPLNIFQLSPNSWSQTHVSRPSTIQGCSSTNTSFPTPTIISRSRSQQPGSTLSKNRLQPCIVSGGTLVGASHNIRKANGHLIGNSSPQFVSSHTMFKRPGNIGVTLPRNQSACSSLNNKNRVTVAQYVRTPTSTPALDDLNTIRWDNILSTTHQSSFDQNLVSTALNTLPSQPETYSQHVPPSNDNQHFYQPGNQFQNNGQSIYNHGNETQNSSQNARLESIGSVGVEDASTVNYSSSWVNNAVQSIQQPPVEDVRLQSTESLFEPSVQVSDISTDFGFDDWLLEAQSVPAVADGSMPPPLDVFSPEPAPIDADMKA
ncbi:hypothetical protein PanWU01x14_322500 [Parasponia andersonii]|uniref:RPM1 interacting protein 13 n=1 Tax=Parasponia andersonii TaxID=3476 RepID=A0A2P5AKR1_PARAD|nr:hypothetical protein PanWU01x14_322500 [Parasponia andersonii]